MRIVSSALSFLFTASGSPRSPASGSSRTLARAVILAALGSALTACATAGDQGGGADAAPVNRPDARQTPDAHVMADAPVDIDAPPAADAHPAIDAPSTPDSPIAMPDASIRNSDAGIVTGTIVTMNMTPPATGATVSLTQAVIVATRISSSSGKPDRYGELFLQDNGGGLYAGAHVFCDTSPQSPPACDTAMRDLIETLEPGDVVNVTGTYSRYMTEPPEIKVPTITMTGTTAMIQAVAVDPSMLARSETVLPLSLANVYVEVPGPITVSSTTASEFASSSGACAANADAGVSPDAGTGVPYLGFEAKAGNTTLAIGFDFSYTLDYCLPDCPGYSCVAPNLITQGEQFGSLLGIASVETFTTPEYVRIDPIHDSDMSQ